ncbi:hypothetical protein LCGC14_0439470 [marine sediment metagenome]|uniref:Uncharacterized protein n=1 Tax=marine sediment metagenome TaxID=412755 RepID=A0A0F9SRV3_9ZZZZ
MKKKSEILIELEENYKEMTNLCDKQILTVGDAERFMARYFNVIRKFEQLVESRDKWRAKYEAEKGRS